MGATERMRRRIAQTRRPVSCYPNRPAWWARPSPRTRLVLTVWEPVASWTPSDPATGLSAPLSRLASKELDLDEMSQDAARELMQRGVELATGAGFHAEGRLEKGSRGALSARWPMRSTPNRSSWAAVGLDQIESAGAGHMSNLQRPEQFNAAVREFCRAHSSRSADPAAPVPATSVRAGAGAHRPEF